MKYPTLEERREWWLRTYAHISFKLSLSCCDQLLDRVDSTSHELYSPLFIATHVYYGKPFKPQRGVGKLEDDYVPDGYRGLHKSLITFRDKVIAHADADITKEVGKPLLDLVYHIAKGGNKFSTSDPRPALDYYKHIQNYLPVLIEKARKEIGKYHRKYRKLIPRKKGEYLFNLEGGRIFTPYEPLPEVITFGDKEQDQPSSID